MTTLPGFDNTYPGLGDAYSARVQPTPVGDPHWILWNDDLARHLDWPADWQRSDEALAGLAGNRLLADTQPWAAVYAGHQFGSYNPQLGDGRALVLGEWVTADGQRFDIQLKGSGPTPFSRGGDGRAPVGPVIREFLMSEAMHALGVPTTRALAAIATGEPVYRNSPEPGAVLTRVARSHLRIGSLQYFAMTQGGEGLEELVDYTVQRHYADALDQARLSNPDTTPAEVLLREASRRLAALVAHWQGLGFIHGVLNTDNMLLCGDTVDYGPCAFMDGYDAKRVFSSIDTQGRYAYGNQPGIVHWNLSVLAQCLLPLIRSDEESALAIAQAVVDEFPQHFSDAHSAWLAAKFGLDGFTPQDRPLVDGFFAALGNDELDLTLAFRWLTETAAGTVAHTPLPELFQPSQALEDWLPDWRARRAEASAQTLERMAAVNPVVIPRNHQVAQAIAEAERRDYTTAETLFSRWHSPFTWQTGDDMFAAGPLPGETVHRTFCGT